MMKHLSIIAFICSSFITVTSQVKAESFKAGDVFYCISRTPVDSRPPDYKIVEEKIAKFRFKIIDESKLKFSGNMKFIKDELYIKAYSPKYDYLQASDLFSIFFLVENQFHYVYADTKSASMMTGTCDKF